MELRLKFDEDAANYDKFRPKYAPGIFTAIAEYAGGLANKCALEIGIGTGQATGDMLKAGCRITAVELGASLAEFSRAKFSECSGLNVITADFMELDAPENAFDAIYSATAFHWIPPETGLPKVLRLLKPGGVLALFWNHPYVNRSDEPTHAAMRAAYQRHMPPLPEKKLAEFCAEDMDVRAEQLRKFGFSDVRARLFSGVRTLTATEYLGLMNTYSDHRALPQEKKVALERDIEHAIESTGGLLKIYDTMDLYLARKPQA